MQKHWKNNHPGHLNKYSVKECYQHPVYIQSYFSAISNTYCAVNPDIKDHGSDDLYAAYLRGLGPLVYDHGDFDAPQTTYDILLWLHFAAFNDYLGDLVTNKTKCALLFDATELP